MPVIPRTGLRRALGLGLALACGAIALGRGAGAAQADPASGDPAAGATVAETCAACHGAKGESNGETWPRLAGQRAEYLAKQLADFRAGTRADPSMTPMAAALSPQQVADVAAYFAAQPAPAVHAPDPGPDGARLYLAGRPERNLPPCIGCHGSRGAGFAGVFVGGVPTIAGQQPAYVRKQLADFAAGARTNDDKGVMRAVASRLDEADRNAIAAYVAGLR